MAHPKLHVHAYAGRENGLMIIGSAEELGNFASDLQEALKTPAAPRSPDWPVELVTLNADSPFADCDYKISFHLRGEGLSPALSKRPGSKAANAFLWVFALIGLASTIWLAARHF